MFRQYREFQENEFIIAGGDCAQGGNDFNACQFLSVTHLDIPLVYHSRGTATNMTNAVHPVLEKIHDVTDLPPCVGFERNMGGASEMDRLEVLNRNFKYTVFKMPTIGQHKIGEQAEETNSLGVATTTITRPMIMSLLKTMIDNNTIRIYDADTIDQLFSFVKNNMGKPEAATGTFDDLVMALGIALFIREYVHVPVTTKSKTPSWYDSSKSYNVRR